MAFEEIPSLHTRGLYPLLTFAAMFMFLSIRSVIGKCPEQPRPIMRRRMSQHQSPRGSPQGRPFGEVAKESRLKVRQTWTDCVLGSCKMLEANLDSYALVRKPSRLACPCASMDMSLANETTSKPSRPRKTFWGGSKRVEAEG